MQDDSSTASDQNPNELGTEMSEAEEQAFVNKTLGIGDDDAATTDSEDGDSEGDTGADTEGNELAGGSSGDDGVDDEEGDDGGDSDQDSSPKSDREETTASDESEEDKSTTELDENGIQTDDLWVEVEKIVIDKDGKESAEKVKLVYDPTNPGAFLPDDFKFKDDKHLFEILGAKVEMANIYKERQAEFDTKTQEAEAKSSKEQADQAIQAGWDSEIESLIDAGVLEAPKAKPSDKNFLEDPAVQKLDEVFKYMGAQNEARSKDGKPPLRSFGTAMNLMNRELEAQAEKDKMKQDNKLAKQRGSLVGGTSAGSSSDGPSYTRGSASNIWSVKVPE